MEENALSIATEELIDSIRPLIEQANVRVAQSAQELLWPDAVVTLGSFRITQILIKTLNGTKMFGKRPNKASQKNKNRWYELPLAIAIITCAIGFFGQSISTILPIWSSDTGEFYINVEPVPIEAKLASHDFLPTTMDNWTQLLKEPQSPNANVSVQDINWILKNYRFPVFLGSDDKYNKLHNLIIRFETPTKEPPFTAKMFVYTTEPTKSIDNLPITIEGIGGNGKRCNCTVYIFYKSSEDLTKEGIVQALLENYSNSIKLFNKSIEINQNYAPAWKNKAIVLSRYLGNNKEALRCINQSLDLNLTDEETWHVKGAILSVLGYYNESLKCFDKAIEIKPQHAPAWNDKGIVLNTQGNHVEAIKAYERALRFDPNLDVAWNNKGNALSDLGKYDDAIRAYNESLKLDPNDAVPWNNKGNALYDLVKYGEAIRAYDRAIELNPQYSDAWISKGIALGKQGKHSESIKAYEEALNLNSSLEVAWYNKGIALGNLRKYDEAIQAYDEAIRLNPKHKMAWNNKARALYLLGRTKEAEIAFAKAKEMG